MNNSTIFLLSIRGSLAAPSLEAARKIHNSTAGAPANVAAARGLGDLSHMVYVPVEHPGSEFLILDQWNSMDGLNQFFANPHVQQQAGEIFSARDPVVWAPAPELINYHFPAPYGKNERYVGIVRGLVHSREHAEQAHNQLVSGVVNQSRMAGSLSHETYYRLTPPGAPASLEFFAVDTWFDAQGMSSLYENPDFVKGFMGMFAGQPDATVWAHPAGDWVEW